MLIIFDLDGTLLNTIDDLAAAANYALEQCGFAQRSVEQCCQFVGNGVTKLLERCLPGQARNAEHMACMQKAFFDYYDAHLADRTRPYEGIESLLAQLQVRGIKLAVCSNKYQRATTYLIAHFFPQIQFACVLGQREGIPLKPHPAVIEEILRTAREPKESCLYVGDGEADMQVAHNAAVMSCGVTWGFRPRETLEAFRPHYLIDTPAQLLLLPKIKDYNCNA